jgi:hypothetical protein
MKLSAGPDGPGGEVVAVGLGQEVGVEFRRKELSVHCLVLAFFFETILLFDLSGLIRLELLHSSDDLVRERNREWVLNKKSSSKV